MIGDENLTQLLAMVRTSQQFSRDVDERELVAIFLRAVLSVTAAHRVRLVRDEGCSLLVTYEARHSQESNIDVTHEEPFVQADELIRNIFCTASQTNIPVIFGITSSDPKDVQANQGKYVVENPMLGITSFNGGRNKQILILDRHHDAPPFRPSLIPYLEILSAQTAVKFENVRLRLSMEAVSSTREEVEIALRANEKELAHIQRMSGTGSWVWYAFDDMIEASSECFRIYAIPTARRAPSVKFTDLTHPDDIASVRIALERAVRARRMFKLEFRIAVGFGEIKYIQIEGHPQIDETGRLQYVGVTVDVTERRNAENALQAARAELARAHRLSAMGELTASIVHEIYQPLTGIITNAEVCLRWLSKSPAETTRANESARRVVRDARRAVEVFRGLRAVAANSGVVKVPVDLDDAIREVAFILQGELDRANIRLRLQTTSTKPVLGDRTQIQQVIENLMRNAMDALTHVVGTQRLVTVDSEPHNTAFALVSVYDNGCGFGQHSSDELFAALFTTKPNGMGMGLKVCRSIIESHGGTLQAERCGDDTVFRFTLPYIDGASDR
ncbi:ATP-binding protein [Burkholderia sp. Ac-20365]|uniref:sensor histidine kinase n=1 Tax=Burkholderia sp. Ac-20365 TaxID=2703897 RepID=UPI00197C3A46|nr:ATP-binding protein [Burkholderia sp. Ac-20365]MBN3759248.1 GHKL domain-containing protein [Burkholderia sp. Ac-20365]